MSVVLCAYHEMGAVALDTLCGLRIPVVRVYTHADDPGEAHWFRSVAELAERHGIPVSTADRLDTPEELAALREAAPDLLVSVHYRAVLPPGVLAVPRLGGVNLHPSLLPRYRGRAPINWQLVHGERRSGVTLHRMVERVDAGPILGQEAVVVGADDTAAELYARLIPAAQRVLERCIPALLAGEAIETPQDESAASHFGCRTPEDGRLDWGAPAQQLHNLVRAVAPPWPGAFADLPDGRLWVYSSRVATAPGDAPAPGAVFDTGVRTLVGTGDGVLELVRYAAPGGRLLRDGERLVPPPVTSAEVTS